MAGMYGTTGTKIFAAAGYSIMLLFRHFVVYHSLPYPSLTSRRVTRMSSLRLTCFIAAKG